MKVLKIWTDGSCVQSTKVGGAAAVFVWDNIIVHELKQQWHDVTNNQMEIAAITLALRAVFLSDQKPDRVEVHSDSQYCIGVLTEGWKRNTNHLWLARLDEVIEQLKSIGVQIQFYYTRGHESDFFNNRADLLATIASGYKKTPADFHQTTWQEGSQEEQQEETPIDQPKIQTQKPMVIAIDFDGTVVTHMYPVVGRNIGAAPVLKALQERGHQFILYTMRDKRSASRNCLQDAADWFGEHRINLIGINCNPWQKTWTDSPKVYAHRYIDDAAIGTPVLRDPFTGRNFVDWVKMLEIFVADGFIPAELQESIKEQVIDERERALSIGSRA